MAEEAPVELEDAQMTEEYIAPSTTVTVEPGTTEFHTLGRLYC